MCRQKNKYSYWKHCVMVNKTHDCSTNILPVEVPLFYVWSFKGSVKPEPSPNNFCQSWLKEISFASSWNIQLGLIWLGLSEYPLCVIAWLSTMSLSTYLLRKLLSPFYQLKVNAFCFCLDRFGLICPSMINKQPCVKTLLCSKRNAVKNK